MARADDKELTKRYYPVYLKPEDRQLADSLRPGFANDNQMFLAGLRALAGHQPHIDLYRLLQQERLVYIRQVLTTLFDSIVHRTENTPDVIEARNLLTQLLGDTAPAVEEAFHAWWANAQSMLVPATRDIQPEAEQPLAIIVEDQESHALLAETLFHHVGFETRVASSLPEGEEIVFFELSTKRPARPILILLDLLFPSLIRSDGSRLEGSLLAARLTEGMAQGVLHPAWIIAITGDVTREREEEARNAGCYQVLIKPLQAHHIVELQRLVATPPRRPASDPMRRAAASAFPMLHTPPESGPTPSQSERNAQGASTDNIWDYGHIYDLLFAPGSQRLQQRPWSTWLECHGGIGAVRKRLLEVEHLTKSSYELLKIIMATPYVAGQEEYMNRLHVSDETYRRYRKKLIEQLQPVLNAFARIA